ncbi:hypothetical protein FZC66_12470 [Priestia megaterium]|nr:hypothetical protein FZC66_12470 [Priestia megaterium]
MYRSHTNYSNHYYSDKSQDDRFDLSQVYPFPQYHQQSWQGAYMPQYPYAQPQYQMPYMIGHYTQPFYNHMGGIPFPNPYPKGSQKKPQPTQFQSLMSQFKSSDGNYDVNKMMNTAGQMMGAVNQLTTLVKGFSGIFKV